MSFKYLKISKGMRTKIDADDFEKLKRDGLFFWCAQKTGKKYYVSKNVYIPGPGNQHRKIYLHRYLMDAPTGMVVDHINGDPLDNRKQNLRVCYHRDNMRNKRTLLGRRKNFLGVIKPEKANSWRAQIGFGGKGVTLGSFSCPEDAAKMYDFAAVLLFGNFAVTNFQLSKQKFSSLRETLLEEIKQNETPLA